jgi:O-methyltransferase
MDFMNYAWKFSDERAFDIPTRTRSSFPDVRDELFWELYERCAPFSMVHIPGFLNAFQSIKYIKANEIAGDLVECGCHMGGMGIFMALLCKSLGMARRIVLFDTFSGFPVGQEDSLVGQSEMIQGGQYPSFLDDVQDNIAHLLGNSHMIELVVGDVEQTIPISDVAKISLLRLDTDFYVSTRAELENLYPKLSREGVLIVDDYGFFQGSRRATDEYLGSLDKPPLLNRIDGAVWSGVKP